MSSPVTYRDRSRADLVVQGLWRLPLPVGPRGIRRANVYALTTGGAGVVLVDSAPHTLEVVELGLETAGHRLDDVAVAVSTDAHRTPGEPLLLDRTLAEGDVLATDLGDWMVLETPGRTASQICLYQPDRRLLLSGNVVVDRVAPSFEFGSTADPVGEHLASLARIAELDVGLVLPGHGRPFCELGRRVAGHRAFLRQRLHVVRCVVARTPAAAGEIGARLYADAWRPDTVPYLATKVLAYLRHLEVRGEVERLPGQPERWLRCG